MASKQIYVDVIPPTSGAWVALASVETVLRHFVLRAQRTSAGSATISVRRKDDDSGKVVTLEPDSGRAFCEYIGVDLAQIEVNVPDDMELVVDGSPS